MHWKGIFVTKGDCMAVMVAPEGDLWLGKVPWDNTYRHVYYEGMRNKSLIVSSFCDLHTVNYSYIPKNGIIRVPYNADELIGYNYCVYQNNSQLFCAFVTTPARCTSRRTCGTRGAVPWL